MGRSNGGANGGGAGNSAATKVVGGAAALVIALVCYVFGIQPSSGGSASSANNAQVTASQTSASEAVGNLTFRNEERLKEHYEKHGKEMGFASAEAYLAAANEVVSNPAALRKTEAEDGDDAYFLEDTGEFVVVSQKGYIRTYFLTDRDYFERQ